MTRARSTALVAAFLVLTALASARADAFSAYALDRSFQLPAGASSFDVLADGRVIAVVDAQVYVESGVASGAFSALGTLPGADVAPGPFATAFVRVSPDGARFAVGNNGGSGFGNYQVGVFDVAGLGGSWHAAEHFNAAWIDNRFLALTAGAFGEPAAVVALDTASPPASPESTTLVANIGGSPAGIAFDALGNLYTGNGFDAAGPSQTGWVKGFNAAAWQAVLSGGAPLDFEATGQLIVDTLSAGSLGFDGEGNLHVGGGDFFGGGDYGFAALLKADDVLAALGGGAPIDVNSPLQARKLDPDPVASANLYDVNYNAVTGELYLRDGHTVYSFSVPEPETVFILAACGLFAAGRSGRSGR